MGDLSSSFSAFCSHTTVTSSGGGSSANGGGHFATSSSSRLLKQHSQRHCISGSTRECHSHSDYGCYGDNNDEFDHIDDTYDTLSMSYRSHCSDLDTDDGSFLSMANKLQRQRMNRTRTKALLCQLDQQDEICKMFQGVRLTAEPSPVKKTALATQDATNADDDGSACQQACDSSYHSGNNSSSSSSIPSTTSD